MKKHLPFLQTSILLLGIILSGLLQSCGHGKCHCDDDYGGYSDVSDKMKSFFPYKEGSYYVFRLKQDPSVLDTCTCGTGTEVLENGCNSNDTRNNAQICSYYYNSGLIHSNKAYFPHYGDSTSGAVEELDITTIKQI